MTHDRRVPPANRASARSTAHDLAYFPPHDTTCANGTAVELLEVGIDSKLAVVAA